MAASGVSAPATRNRLLSALQPEVLEEFWPRLERVELVVREVLHPPGEPIRNVFFLETGYVSKLAYTEDGDAAEVGMTGCEGFVGLPILLDAEADDVEAMVQQPGTGLRMETAAFRKALERHPALRTILNRYALLHHGQVARTAACNLRHQLEQRLARWLLMSHDRTESDSFAMTHEFLSMMLGVRRSGITVAAGLLQKAGMIRYGAGRIEVTDRPGLESVSCECYGIVRRASEALFGLPPGARALYRA
ncbi:Crp/Fnr family transcriptional regulator [Muricoccus radiodurans]|uniref:Crp/Fnr family transcriptional regulator n=1 Tax=Muricoccus radiodurans TaxID=2231721 RepID=UPI003CF845AA